MIPVRANNEFCVSRLSFTVIRALAVNRYPWFRDKGKDRVKGQWLIVKDAGGTLA